MEKPGDKEKALREGAWDLESLKRAITNADITLVKEMLAAFPFFTKLSSPRRSTALHQAASSGQAEIAALLIRAGSDVNARDKYEETPLYNAALFGHVDAARVLVAHGASIDPINYKGETPLYRAIQQKNHPMMIFLVESGADINLGATCGWTPLHRASMDGNLESAQYLAGKGAKLDVFSDGGTTALFMASTREMSEFLLSRGAQVNASLKGGEGTPLDAALHYGRQDIAEFLHSRGGKRFKDLKR